MYDIGYPFGSHSINRLTSDSECGLTSVFLLKWLFRLEIKIYKNSSEQQDAAIYQLLTDPQYKFATVLPDGTYKQ